MRSTSDFGCDVADLIAAGGLDWLEPTDDLRLVAGVLSSSLLAMCVADGDRRLRFASDALVRMWGYGQASEVVGRSLEELLVDGDHASAWALLELNGEAHGDAPARRADGSVFDVEYMARLVRGEDGDPLCTVATFLDVTEDRRAEEQLRHAQRMEAVGQLAAGVAHDFNNLLMAISSHADLLRLKLGPASPVQRHVDEIKDATARAADLVSKMLAFGKRQILRTQEVDLNRVVSGVVERLQAIVGDAVRVQLSLDEGIAPVRGDAAQLERAILNLVENGCEAMPDGGTLQIETTAAHGEAGGMDDDPTAPAPRHVEVTVRDSGHGMDEHTLVHVFDPFFTTWSPGSGHSGLGLSQVWGIVEQTGGTVVAESEPGGGASFRIRLPTILPSTQASLATPLGEPSPRGSTRRVLVAEDDPRVRAALRESLRELGYEVLEAGDGDEAVVVSDGFAGSIDVLVTDLVMPGLSAQELVGHLVARRPELRVLVITAYRDQEGGPAVLPPGRSALLLKPFSLEDLKRALGELVG